MRNPHDPKSQYVDISYGWRDREEIMRLRQRRKRRWWIVLAAVVTLGVILYFLWRLG